MVGLVVDPAGLRFGWPVKTDCFACDSLFEPLPLALAGVVSFDEDFDFSLFVDEGVLLSLT